MKAPTVEERIEDIRRRGLILEFAFEALAVYDDNDIRLANQSDLYRALSEYAGGIVPATRAIDAAERGMENPPAPDVELDQAEGGA